jgi:pSer/pThr/pTyr-binding forkhead associated (FHA) protein
VEASPAAEGTAVFTGSVLARAEASITEIKPDGTMGRTVPILNETAIGREGCDLPYPDDQLLSARHACLTFSDGRLTLRDLGSEHGVYLKQRQDSELQPGDVFLLGRDLFRFSVQSLNEGASGTQVMDGAPMLYRAPLTARLEHMNFAGEVIEQFTLEKPETNLGRTTGDLVFPNDPYMSGRHARVVAQPGRFLLQDLKSRNGTYRRIRHEVELGDADQFFLGEQLFRVQLRIS